VVANYRINLDALLARIVYRWRWRIAIATLLLAGLAALAAGVVPPVWRGEATLVVRAAPEASILVDGRPWPRQLYAGRHTVSAQLPDGRRAWAQVELRSGETLQLDLPSGLPTPQVRQLPASAPNMEVAQVWRSDGAWRVLNSPRLDDLAVTPTPADAQATPQPVQTVAFGLRGAERLTTIDAYGGLADQLHLEGRLLEAVYRPAQDSRERAAGSLEVRGWGGEHVTIPISGTVTLVQFAPDGSALLVGERTPAGGEEISLVGANQQRAPIVAVPGAIRRLAWHPDGSAVVIHSQADDRLALTLARLRPSIAAVTVAELDAAAYRGALVPLTWAPERLLWVAPDTAGVSRLWSASLATLIPEDAGPLDARALDYRPGGWLRVAVAHEDELVIGRYQRGLLIGEASVPAVALTPDLHGIWHDGELLLHGAGGVWLVTLDE